MRCDKGSNMCPRQTTPPTNNMSRMNDNSWNKVVAGVVTCNLTASGGAAITTCKTSVIAALPQQWLACQLFCSRVFFLGLESLFGWVFVWPWLLGCGPIIFPEQVLFGLFFYSQHWNLILLWGKTLMYV
jgi:hypothetical protein